MSCYIERLMSRRLLLWGLLIIGAGCREPTTNSNSQSAPVAQTSVKQSVNPASQPVYDSADALKKAVAEQVALLPQCNLEQLSVPGTFEIDSPAPGTPDAAGRLVKMGPRIIPFLVDALADTRLTKTETFSGNGRRFPVQVNEIVGRLIRELSGRHFSAGQPPYDHSLVEIAQTPELVPQFQKAVRDWYGTSQNQTPLQRKLALLNDSFFRNRLDAVEWLGQHKVREGGPAISAYIGRTLDGLEKQVDSLSVSEVSEAVFALGQIGDPQNLPTVQRACWRLSNIWATYRMPVGSMDISDLVQAYHGLAMLGEKDAAVKELTGIYESHRAAMEPQSVQEFKGDLRDAESW